MKPAPNLFDGMEEIFTDHGAESTARSVTDIKAHPERLKAYRTGKAVQDGGRKGHEQTYGTAEEKRKRWKDMQDYRDEGHSQKETVDHFKVSLSTVARHTRKRR